MLRARRPPANSLTRAVDLLLVVPRQGPPVAGLRRGRHATPTTSSSTSTRRATRRRCTFAQQGVGHERLPVQQHRVLPARRPRLDGPDRERRRRFTDGRHVGDAELDAGSGRASASSEPRTRRPSHRRSRLSSTLPTSRSTAGLPRRHRDAGPGTRTDQVDHDLQRQRPGHNFSFTSELHYPFTYSPPQPGRDVQLHRRRRRVGLHQRPPRRRSRRRARRAERAASPSTPPPRRRRSASSTKGMYSIDLFQAERHTCGSNYTLTLSGFVHTVSQCTPDLRRRHRRGQRGLRRRHERRHLRRLHAGLHGRAGRTAATASQNAPESCDDGTNATTYGGASRRRAARAASSRRTAATASSRTASSATRARSNGVVTCKPDCTQLFYLHRQLHEGLRRLRLPRSGRTWSGSTRASRRCFRRAAARSTSIEILAQTGSSVATLAPRIAHLARNPDRAPRRSERGVDELRSFHAAQRGRRQAIQPELPPPHLHPEPDDGPRGVPRSARLARALRLRSLGVIAREIKETVALICAKHRLAGVGLERSSSRVRHQRQADRCSARADEHREAAGGARQPSGRRRERDDRSESIVRLGRMRHRTGRCGSR